MANPVQLLASYWSIAGGARPHSDHEYSVFSFQDRVASAARAGVTQPGRALPSDDGP